MSHIIKPTIKANVGIRPFSNTEIDRLIEDKKQKFINEEEPTIVEQENENSLEEKFINENVKNENRQMDKQIEKNKKYNKNKGGE